MCKKESLQQQGCPGQIAHTLSKPYQLLLHRTQPQAMLYPQTTGSWWVEQCHTQGLTQEGCALVASPHSKCNSGF